MSETTSEVKARLAKVLAEIAVACAKAGRAAGEVRLIAVSKKQPLERVQAVYEAGHRELGENYVQELERRGTELPADAVLHLIGHVQTNKAKKAAELASMIHTLDSERLAQALSRAVPSGRELEALIEVRLGGEATKAGLEPAAVEPLISAIRDLAGLRVRGLMCIPPSGAGRRHFAELRALAVGLRARTGLDLPHLSMGMSEDFAEAILEGATLVRVGTAIFGARSLG